MKKILAIALLLLAQPAQAKDIVLILNDDEQGQLVRLLDAAVRAQGLGVAASAALMLSKLQSAPAMQKNEPKPEAKPEPKPEAPKDPPQ